MQFQTEAFRKVNAKTAAEVANLFDLSDEGSALLRPELSPQAFLDALVQGGIIGDAIRFLAFALPIREAVWWGCVMAHTSLERPTELETECLRRAAAWVYGPTEERRRAAMAAAETARLKGAAAYAAVSVFWSGGSLAPEGLPDVPAPPSLGPSGAAASILLALTAGDPVSLNKRFVVAIQRGIDIANGGNGWMTGDRALVPAS